MDKRPLDGTRICILRGASVERDKRSQQVARLLATAGAEVTIVSVDAASGPSQADSYARVIRVWPSDPSERPNRWFRIAENLLRMWRQHRMLVATIRSLKPDAIHCVNVEVLLAGIRARATSVFVYDSLEHFPSTAAPSRHARKWWMVKERLIVPRVDAVLTVSPPIAADLARRYRVRTPFVFYNGPTSVVESPSPLHSPLRLLHLGKFFADRNLSEVIDSVEALEGAAELILQGWGDEEQTLRGEVHARGLDRVVRFVDPCRPDEVVTAARESDVGIINFRPLNDSTRWAAPNKLFDYMAAGLALVVPDLPFMSSVVSEVGCGVVFEPGNQRSLTNALRRLVENPEEVERMKRRSLEAATSYSLDAQAPGLVELYRSLLEARRGQHEDA